MPSENDSSISSPSGSSFRFFRDRWGQKWSALVMLSPGAGFGVPEGGDAKAQDGTYTAGTTVTDSTINLSAARVHAQVGAGSSDTNNTVLDIGRTSGITMSWKDLYVVCLAAVRIIYSPWGQGSKSAGTFPLKFLFL